MSGHIMTKYDAVVNELGGSMDCYRRSLWSIYDVVSAVAACSLQYHFLPLLEVQAIVSWKLPSCLARLKETN